MREVEAAALLYREAMARELRLRNEYVAAKEAAERIESQWNMAQSEASQARRALLAAAEREGTTDGV